MNTLPLSSIERNLYPISKGCYAYFPAAIAGVALHSYIAGAKYNDGALTHNRWMGAESMDCIERHCMDLRDLLVAKERGTLTVSMYVYNFELKKEELKIVAINEAILSECNALSWRSLDYSQRQHEALNGAPLAPAARIKPDEVVNMVAHEPVVKETSAPVTTRLYGYRTEQKVATIKAIRSISGVGLKEALYALENLPFDVPCIHMTQQEAIRAFRECGAS